MDSTLTPPVQTIRPGLGTRAHGPIKGAGPEGSHPGRPPGPSRRRLRAPDGEPRPARPMMRQRLALLAAAATGAALLLAAILFALARGH